MRSTDGRAHRLWIAAFASPGDRRRFATQLDRVDQHYSVRTTGCIAAHGVA